MSNELEDVRFVPKSAGAAPVRRMMALDVGDRRIGVALSDPLGYTAQPLVTIHRKHLREDLRSIVRLVRRHGVTDVVIGLPLHASGEVSSQAVKTQRFVAALEELSTGVRLHLLDERLTTAEAHGLLDRSRPARRGRGEREQRTAIIDQVAAVLLLEAFLSRDAPQLLPETPESQV